MPLARFEHLDTDRRQAILAAAAADFGERGFEQASYNRIIEQAGISKGAMYYYFADKDDLYRTVLDAALSQWLEHVGSSFHADDAESFWSACEALYARSLHFMLADPKNAALCMAITRARERMEGHPALLELNAKIQMFTTEIVRHGREVSAVRTDVPADLMVQIALSMMDAGDRWLAAHWKEMNKKSVDKTAKMMTSLLRRVGTSEKTR
jgi:AcrR family transcriptional regulator